MKKIAENAGKDGSVVLENVRRAQKEKMNKNVGYNILWSIHKPAFVLIEFSFVYSLHVTASS